MECHASLIAMCAGTASDVELFVTDLARIGFNDLDAAPELLARRAGVPVVVSSHAIAQPTPASGAASGAARVAIYRPGNMHELCRTIRQLSATGEMYLNVVLER